MTDDLSPELRYLLALVRAALGGPPAGSPSGCMTWEKFLLLVERHRLAPLLGSHASGAISELCPPQVAAQLKSAAAANGQRALMMTAQVLRLGRILTSAGIDSLPVKGVVLAEQLYGEIGARHVGDIDLLVRPREAIAADAILRSAGLRRTRPDFALTPRQARAYLNLKPEFEYVTTSGPAMRVELLWRLESLKASDAYFENPNRCFPGGQATRTIDAELNTLYLFLHGARHGWFRLFWLVDIASLLVKPGYDWASLMLRARRLRVERSVLQGAAMAHELFGVAVPPALAVRPDESANIDALVREARRQILRSLPEKEGFREWLRQTLYRVRLQIGVRAKCAMLAPHVFSPLNWATLPLPDRWFFLYYLATPFLWLWRRARPA